MYKCIAKYKGIGKFDISESQLGLIEKLDTEKRLSVYDSSSLKELVRFDQYNTYDFIFLNDSKILFSTLKPEKTFSFDGDSVIEEQDYVLHLGGMHFDDNFYCLSNVNEALGFIELNLSKIEIKRFWKLPFFTPKGLRNVFGNYLITHYNKNSLMMCHDLSTGEELWNIELNELLGGARAIVLGNIIYYEDQLFFNLEDIEKNKSTCYVAKISTGEIVYKCHLFGGYIKKFQDTKLYAINYKLGSRRKINGGVNEYLRNVVFSLDLKTLEETYIDISVALDALDIKNDNGEIEQYFKIKPDKIVVLDNTLYCHSFSDSRIAVINLKSNELTWSTTIHVEKYPYQFVKELRVFEKRLYILDAGGTLHIYDKQL